MKHIYYLQGMSCNGCRNHVQKILSEVVGVSQVTVDLEKAEALIEMREYIPIDKFQKALQDDGGSYSIHADVQHCCGYKKTPPPVGNLTGVFYCPMHCEGDKVYHKIGDCPICGMDLVLVQPSASTEQQVYQSLLKKIRIAVVFTLPIFLIAMSDMMQDNPLYDILGQKYWNWVQLILSIPVVFYATWMFFERAYKSIVTANLNMFTLVGISSAVAWLFSVFGLFLPGFFPNQFKTDTGAIHVYFEAATVILTLVLLGQLLEARAHNSANSAIKNLLKLAPKNAIKIVDEEEVEIDVDDIQINDILKVKSGDKIPVDGILVKGNTSIDESMITGEPIPVNKSLGESIHSGTINGNQPFLMEAKKVSSQTLLAQIIQMVNDASRSRAPIQNLADKVSRYFVPIVMVISLITFIIWSVWGASISYALVNAIAVLIIACPCALGLATPMSVMVGVGRGAQNGVLIKNAVALEKTNQIDILVVDKTGTLTEGKPMVEKIGSFDDSLSEKEVLQYVVSLNNHSEHLLADATVKYGKQQNIKLLEVEAFFVVVGKGVRGNINGQEIIFGNFKMMDEVKATISLEIKEEVQIYQQQGKTVSFLAIDNIIKGYVVISDSIKTSSGKVIKILRDKGIEVVMLTGDSYQTAQTVAKELQITSFKATMLPEDKLEEVRKLQRRGKIVAMVGDGINDAPALAISDVGIAMGTGTDIAIESAMITLVKGDLLGIVKARNLSHTVMRNIKQNLFFALLYNVLGIPIAAGLLYPFFGILLSPMIAALAMSFSSVSVIANALRLRNVTI